ncbi:protein-glutamate methylesterase/protein-glutamine glutaminase [Cellulomonas chengniuliangii]|uniref:Protein-glutamate methylesterase/protein-glutamine glutaminase n=1 Tax=Cellulomonas chengniuliangii TaxID=2968084 RepID=A0ABY5L227_9CELL|nr:chemotaxis response regulator protein-glutamate methylesterase [Cellulomonas chengniuliangii]MCC2307241.1 chemotaxis response regulator protein-glutamate methylesterase [Cellulomonas chengniuliangii]MCC2317863.1 chemotaxis response regulator protein-glutamate methylesterase [Cellulomonas chengniuliangii]UUI75963.1 chemotaxis response regulator protein-glutamate methylesterase [Cellulomonas chengniuliangii]
MTRIRVLVVDDSVVIRRLVTEALSTDASIEVVGSAPNGRIALAKVDQLGPDIVTMDVEMPEMNGIDAVRELRRTGHSLPIVMFSTLTEKGAAATLDALVAGASDYVTKPSGSGSVQESLQRVAEQLLPKIHALVGPQAGSQRGKDGAPSAAEVVGQHAAGRNLPASRGVPSQRAEPRHPVRAVVLGSSTGGPEALSRLLSALGQPLPVPMLVVQHMPPVFTRQLAARLDRLGPSTVVECRGDEELLRGHVYVAPGNHHLELRRAGSGLRTALTQAPPVNFCRPSVDVLFRSAVQVLRGDLLGVVLTGMGADGRTGCEDVVTAGGTVMVQDQASSVVWGMPGVVANAGLAHEIVPLDDMGRVIESFVARSVAHAGARRAPATSGGAAS